MRNGLRIFVFGLLSAVALYSCTLRDEVITTSSSAKLSFSTDTVAFDTVFSTAASITRRLKVYNTDNNAVNISSIEVAGGSRSPYSLVVNGQQGSRAENVRLLGGDSLLILVTVKLDPAQKDLPFIVNDSILFLTNGNRQHVKLLSWGQDAHFFRNDSIRRNTTWRGSKAFVIYDNLWIDSLQTLTIEEGTSVHLAPGASVFCKGTLMVKGTAQNPVKFGGTRLDMPYRDVPGQWSSIYFTPGSKNNLIEYAVIRNGTVGIWLGTPDPDNIPDLTINHTIIENMSGSGVMGFTSDLVMTNTLINNCAQYTAAGIAGGNYLFRHCTFATYNTFFRDKDKPSFALTNILQLDNNEVIAENLKATVENCIIWGTMGEELQLSPDSRAGFQVLFRGNILRTKIATLKTANLTSDVLQYPKFKKPEMQDFRLDTLSPAKDAGLPLGILTDLKGKQRDSKPDIGAYEK